MKLKLITLTLSIFVSGFIFSQAKNESWLVKIDKAIEISNSTKKPILANFTGSDWCGWCVKLKKEVFNTTTFKTWAKENVVLLELDFPRRKQLPKDIKAQNQELAQRFQVKGFPTIWVFNITKKPETKEMEIEILGKAGYMAGGPKNWTAEINKMIKK